MKRDVLLIVLGTVAMRVAVVALFGIRKGPDTLLYIDHRRAVGAPCRVGPGDGELG